MFPSADAHTYRCVLVRRALAELGNDYRAYLWRLVTKDVAHFCSPLHFKLALGNYIRTHTHTHKILTTCYRHGSSTRGWRYTGRV